MRKNRQKRILVTGGAGFIGSHLCGYLLKRNHQVICLDNFFTGSMNNIKDFLKDKHFELIEHDITAPVYLKNIDEIYNLACPASPVHYQYDPVKTIKDNVFGAINILELARKTRAKVLQASTSEVYGDPQIHPQKETYNGNVNPLSLRACYDEGKRCAETLFMDYFRQYNLPIKIVRIFNTYGPNMNLDDGRVVSNFIIQALNNRDITVYGNGRQTRSFQYISDLIRGLVKMMTIDNFAGPVNLGNPQEIEIIFLAKKIIQLSKSKSKITFRLLPKDDPARRKPDIVLAQKKLKWRPKVKLDDGLKRTISYFISRIS